MNDRGNIRKEFPFFVQHPGLAYLDNAATTQKPASVIRGITDFYEKQNANIHRGLYDVAAQTTKRYEAVRQKIASHIGAGNPKNIVFTSGTTTAINLVAFSFLAPRLQAGDEVVISAMEHHANLIPWQQVCAATGTKLRVAPVSQQGELEMATLREMLTDRVKMLAITQISNTLGTVNPIGEITETAHRQGIPVLVDGAQGAALHPLQVDDSGVDFYAFSGHKMFGPTGVGVLFGREEHLAEMPPIHFGGDMIREVTFEAATFAPPPQRFEAGTTNIAGVIGLGHALDFLENIDRSAVLAHLGMLTEASTETLQKVEGLEIIGTAENKSAIVSFTLKNVHPHDVSTFLGAEQIAVRAGHHCTQPLMDFLGIPGTVRASFSIYNTLEEVERLAAAVAETQRFFS